MKIIALLPFKNESCFLPTYLSSILPIVDEIIAIDDNSSDNSAEILEAAGAHIYKNQEIVKSGWAEHSIRQNLLHLGRKQGGTHFVCLDADETFSFPFIANAREKIFNLRPGQKLLFKWIALWKSPLFYRIDKNASGDNYKDFIFCDDGKIEHDYVFLGVGRTPGNNSKENMIKISQENGVALHFQFIFWQKFQIKQAWYRCSELIKKPLDALGINFNYSHTLGNEDVKTAAVPTEWLKNIILPKDLDNYINEWRYKQMLAWFDQYGIIFFEPLQIWQVAGLKEEFIRQLGREPRPKLNYYTIKIRWLIKKILPKKIFLLIKRFKSYGK